MRYDFTEKLLKGVRRHLWLQGLIDRLGLGFLVVAGILGVAAILHNTFAAMQLAWWASLALVPIAAAVIATAVFRPSLEAAARAADRWLDTRDVLTAAWYLRSQTPRSASAATRVVLDQANQVAADPPRSLPRLRSSRHPLPMAMAVAVAATSLFFLSLEGAVPAGNSPDPSLDEPLTRNPAVEDDWLSAFEPGLTDAPPLAEGRQFTPKPPASSAGSSNGPPPRGSSAAEKGEQGDSDQSARSAALRATQGAGAGPVASGESPTKSVRNDRDGPAAPPDFRFVPVQRKPADEATATDRAVSVQLVPLAGGSPQPLAGVRDVPAARAGRQPFTTAGGPAHSALQARYLENMSQND
jgi:hypothetical protein